MDTTAAAEPPARARRLHPVPVRVMHWINAVAMIIMMAWLYWMGMTQGVWVISGKAAGPPFPMSFVTGWTLTRLTMYVVSAALIAFYCRIRFDRLAGRTP